MPSTKHVDADIAILGSGFAGSLCGIILSKIGFRVVVVDRARHPRFTIGESSTPIANMILRSLSQRYDLPWLKALSLWGPWQETYPEITGGRKRGFSYFAHQKGHPFKPDPLHGNELLVAASRDDYHSDTQWLREEVDAFFADKLREARIPFFEDMHLHSIQDGPRWIVTGHQGDDPMTIRAQFLLDATGAGGVVPKALGISRIDHTLQTTSRALFTHVQGIGTWHDLMQTQGARVADHPYYCDDAALHHLLAGGWMWMLRFKDHRVSTGLVLDTRRHPLDPTLSPSEEWQSWLRAYPSLAQLFEHNTLVDPPGRWMRTGRLQRRWKQVTGPNWALLPFTAGFVDPLHSTGIAHTLSGVEHLLHLFASHWEQPTFETGLQAYESRIQQELMFIDQLVYTCYQNLHDFSRFSAATMLYFAATISYEQARAAFPEDATSTPFATLFLNAGEEQLCKAVEQATRFSKDQPGFEQFVEAAIAPYNTAGLFHPEVPNMYQHTAAPL